MLDIQEIVADGMKLGMNVSGELNVMDLERVQQELGDENWKKAANFVKYAVKHFISDRRKGGVLC